jgi:predicted CoA-substrate-specific enzyme activase
MGITGVISGKLADIIDPGLLPEITRETTLGIDIGSTTGKAILLHGGNYYAAITATGVFSQETADKLLIRLFNATGLSIDAVRYIIGTGYGRISVDFGAGHQKILTEISCHAMGAHYLDSRVKTIIDIGGQDSKGIKIDHQTGKVLDFIMNDKCAAGTGRFLEKTAYLLGMPVEELGAMALLANRPAEISSQCVVFGESEIISLKAGGESTANIAAGVHIATARRIRGLLNRLDIERGILFSGGVSNNQGMCRAIEQVLEIDLAHPRMDTIYNGALGAAILAQKTIEIEKNNGWGI